jgi:1,4-dihydroxy-2-naphthoate octaprenyltransferase
MQFRTLFQSIRPSFLILSPVCVFLGTSTAIASQNTIDTTILLLVFTGALCAHISVNALNEYADFKSGLDLVTVKTPFSGGSGALPREPAMAKGIYFVTQHGMLVLFMGIIGLVTILTYTKWLNRWPLLCLIAPGLGFGLLMVTGTDLVLSSRISLTSWLAALVPFFLVSNLLLLNQYPDIHADKTVGRNHLAIAYGTRVSSYVYGIFFIAAYSTILIGIYYGYFPILSLIALIPFALSAYAFKGALKHAENIGTHTQYLGANVGATIMTPLLLGISLTFG